MKKLKIFLLLSILLCLGFALSSEVHAQGDGPKRFEVSDVLPATTQLKISWDDTSFLSYTKEFTITCQNIDIIGYGYDDYYDNTIFWVSDGSTPYWGSDIIVWNSGWQYYDSGEYYFSDENGGHNYIICNTTGINEARRTVSMIESDLSGDIPIYWEDLNAPSGFSITYEENGGSEQTDLTEQTALPNPLPIPTKDNHTFLGWYYDSDFTNEAVAGDPLTGDVTLYAKWSLTSGPKIFEVGDVLPSGKVRISWDETDEVLMGAYFLEKHQVKSNNNSFNFIERIENNYYIVGINVMTRPEPGIVEFVPPYTVYGEGHSYVDVNTTEWSILKRTISYVYWYETVTFNSKLYWEDITPDGYTQGYLEAKEEFGYYDSRTDEWISVSEYLDLYGTDKPGQSDFYANFDKYFIPAMIIVFGGAIVLTILKVFKGRE